MIDHGCPRNSNCGVVELISTMDSVKQRSSHLLKFWRVGDGLTPKGAAITDNKNKHEVNRIIVSASPALQAST
jgi:hypothetical protein